jgi:G3E family GTPase
MEVATAMVSEQTRGCSSSRHYGHQQHNHHHHHHHHHHHSRSSSVSHEGQATARERTDELQHYNKKRKVFSQ